MAAPPAPLFAQQQQVLTTLVDEWATMTAEERKRMLAAIFDSITANGEGVEWLEPCEDWRPYIVAAIPKPVPVSPDVGAIGAEDGIRTRDPLLGKEMRYHCATSARPWTEGDYKVSGASVPARLA
jgi:hypothetical protein